MPRERSDVQLSKFLAYVLRHRPESIGLTVDNEGWAIVTDLMEKSQAAGRNFSGEVLERIVQNNSKQRFCFNEDRLKIRASHGHSVSVDLGLSTAQPPDILYHGTATKSIDDIRAQGIRKGRRLHVHLSTDIPTAIATGRRHGKPVVLQVNARAMRETGLDFFQSANGVWLVDQVAPQFLSQLEQ